jgi:uncharacterized OsmC-like protein
VLEVPHARLAQKFRDEPARARVTIVVSTEAAAGMRCETTVRDHTVEADEPRSFGGTDAAQSPVELLLTSLATCQAITYRLWAAELGIALDRVGVEVTGDLDLSGFLGTDDGARAGYEGLRIQVTLEGPAPPARYEQLAEAADRHCPVLDALSHPVAIERVLRLPEG